MKLIVLENLGKIDKKPVFGSNCYYEVQKVKLGKNEFYRRQKITNGKVTSVSYSYNIDKGFKSGLYNFEI
jgi:hypothetical protein